VPGRSRAHGPPHVLPLVLPDYGDGWPAGTTTACQLIRLLRLLCRLQTRLVQGSEEWKYPVAAPHVDAMRPTFDDDATFWMPLHDFQSFFNRIHVCKCVPCIRSERREAAAALGTPHQPKGACPGLTRARISISSIQRVTAMHCSSCPLLGWLHERTHAYCCAQTCRLSGCACCCLQAVPGQLAPADAALRLAGAQCWRTLLPAAPRPRAFQCNNSHPGVQLRGRWARQYGKATVQNLPERK
jgi:hypothetical protein